MLSDISYLCPWWWSTCVYSADVCICSLPTDIQAEGIPAILGGGDVLMVCLLILKQEIWWRVSGNTDDQDNFVKMFYL